MVEPLLALKAHEPDWVWCGGTVPSTAVILKDARKLGFSSGFLCNVWASDESLSRLSGAAAEGALGLNPAAVPGDTVPAFEAIREVAAGEPSSTHFVRGWVSMLVLCEVLQRAALGGELTGEAVKKAAETLRAFDTDGLTAPVTYTSTDHRPNLGVRVYRYQQGQLVLQGESEAERRSAWLGN